MNGSIRCLSGSSVRWRAAALALLACLVMACLGCGGNNEDAVNGPKGSVEGDVRNSEGTALPGVTVSVGSVHATTDQNGHYKLDGVPVGTQTVTATLQGYRTDGRGSTSVVVVEGRSASASRLILVIGDGWVYLWHLSASKNEFGDTKQVQLGGQTFLDSLSGWCYDNPSYTAEAIYSVGRRWSRFQTRVGVLDTEANLGFEAVFRVVGDGNVLYQSQNLKVGHVADVDVDISTVLTLQLQVTHIANTGNGQGARVGWGNARVVPK